MSKSRVKWFNEQKGVRFISQDSGEDPFVHFSPIKQDGFQVLPEGNEVELKPARER